MAPFTLFLLFYLLYKYMLQILGFEKSEIFTCLCFLFEYIMLSVG